MFQDTDRSTAAADGRDASVTDQGVDRGRRDALARIAKATYAAPVTIALLNARAQAGS